MSDKTMCGFNICFLSNVAATFFLLIFSYAGVHAQRTSSLIAKPIDTVWFFAPGLGQNTGQTQEYFPHNIFSLPSENAGENTPATSPDEICSLGMGGEIIVGFRDGVLLDRAGDDFIVFENAFQYFGNRIYAEPATVSVSKNGIDYYEFPFDSTTLEGCAGTKPTHGKNNLFNPSESGGNSFDLHAIGIDSVRFIRIKDVTDIIAQNSEHPFWDPTLSGFDLDCVVGLSVASLSTVGISDKSPQNDISFEYSLENGLLQWQSKGLVSSSLYSVSGELLVKFPLSDTGNYALQYWPAGMYLFVLDSEAARSITPLLHL